MKILYIEDNYINRFVFEKTLQKYADIDLAENAKDGLKLCDENNYSLIVVDINLNDPYMDGFDVMAALNQNGYRSRYNSEIVALTSYVGSEWEKKCLDAGFDKYFPKPLELKKIIHSLEKDAA